MKLLITGAAGYIGSVLVDSLIKNGHELVLIDDLSEGNAKSIPGNVTFFKGSYGDNNLLEEIFSSSQIDTVIHLAASSNVPDSVVRPKEYYENNIKNSLTLFEAMIAHNISKIIFSSSAAIYGEPLYLPIDENHPCNPINPYGYSKLFLEEIIQDLAVSKQLEYVIFRFFCAAGATEGKGESREFETHLIPLLTDCLLGTRKDISVFGNDFPTADGSGIRDYVHVEDITHAHVLALQNFSKVKNSIFNIGSDEGYSVLEIIQTAEKLFSIKIAYNVHDRRLGDPAKLVASSQKISDVLGWKQQYGIEDILTSTYKWRKTSKY